MASWSPGPLPHRSRTAVTALADPDAALTVGVLGPAQAWLGDDEVPLRSTRARRLVSALALQHPSTATVDRLAEAIWDGRGPADPVGALQNQVSRLRAALGGGAVETAPGGYRLGACTLDAHAFHSRVSVARGERDPLRRAQLLGEALNLWRGDAYQDLPPHLAGAAAAQLAELRATASEERAAALLDADDAPGAAAVAGELCAREPLREGPHLVLAAALDRRGSRGEALGVLDGLRRRLAAELGIDPSPEVGRVRARLLDGGNERFTGTRPPRPLTAVHGRDESVAAVRALLDMSRLVTLVGPGGVGKTTLGQVVAADVDGCAYVDLVGVGNDPDGEGVGATVARALGVERRDRDGWAPRLADAIGDRAQLLVVDNADDVVAATAELAGHLLRYCPGLRMLATSREPLAVPGERLWPVEPLPATGSGSAAVTLFRERAVAVRPDWAPDPAELDVVMEICRRLDGLPLAVELAAAALRVRSAAELAAQLDRPLDVLHRGSGRHAALRSVFAGSYDRLDPVARRVFDRLGVLLRPFGAATAQIVCANILDGRDVGPVLAVLVERSLLQVRTGPVGTRYSMLETLRHHAREHREATGAEAAALAAHTRAVVAVAEDAAARLFGPDEWRWAAVLDEHRVDIVAAHDRALDEGDVSTALRLARACYLHATVRGRSEFLALPERTLAAPLPPTVEPRSAAEAHGMAADAALLRGEHALAVELVTRGRQAAATAHAPVAAGAFCAGVAGDLALFGGRTRAAAAEYEIAADGFRAGGPPAMAAWLEAARALALGYGGDAQQAGQVAEAAVRAADATGSPSAGAMCRYVLAEVGGGRPDRVRELLEEAVAAAETVDAGFVAGLARLSLATAAAQAGEIVRAAEHYRVLLPLWQLAGNWSQQATTLRTVVSLLSGAGAHAEAVQVAAAVAAHAPIAAWGPDAERLTAADDAAHATLPPETYAAARAAGSGASRADCLAVVMAALEHLGATGSG